MPEQSSLLTVRDLAREEGVTIHRIKYALDACEILPVQRAGIRITKPPFVATSRHLADFVVKFTSFHKCSGATSSFNHYFAEVFVFEKVTMADISQTATGNYRVRLI